MKRGTKPKPFIARVEKDIATGCWNWTGGRDSSGYGTFTIDQKQYIAPRFAAYLWKGFDLNSDLLVLHHCDNPRCVNPEHLFFGTVKDNSQDAIAKGRLRRTFCKRGHELSSENTLVFKHNRLCRICHIIRESRRWRNHA